MKLLSLEAFATGAFVLGMWSLWGHIHQPAPAQTLKQNKYERAAPLHSCHVYMAVPGPDYTMQWVNCDDLDTIGRFIWTSKII